MNKKRFFISHCHKDMEIARVIAANIKRLSLDQIDFWYSSDPRPDGGMGAGDIVFNKIVNCINESVATIVLLTPRSINRPWIYFESGMAQNKPERVIPVCVGIERDCVEPPLINYSCFQLSDIDSLSDFITKLFAKIGLAFYKDNNKQSLQAFISELQMVTRELNNFTDNNKEPDIVQLIEGLKSYIDKKVTTTPNSLSEQSLSYTVSLMINIGTSKKTIEYLEIKETDTVQNVLDRIYYLLDGAVKPYAYMEKWVLKEKYSGAYMIMYEVTSLVPAKYIFKPNLKWEVVKWDGSYNTANSKYHGGIYDF